MHLLPNQRGAKSLVGALPLAKKRHSRKTCQQIEAVLSHSNRRLLQQNLPIAPLATNSLNHLAGKRKQLAHTASFAAFTGRALIIFRAGLALNTVGSFVNGLMPARSFVAGQTGCRPIWLCSTGDHQACDVMYRYETARSAVPHAANSIK